MPSLFVRQLIILQVAQSDYTYAYLISFQLFPCSSSMPFNESCSTNASTSSASCTIRVYHNATKGPSCRKALNIVFSAVSRTHNITETLRFTETEGEHIFTNKLEGSDAWFFQIGVGGTVPKNKILRSMPPPSHPERLSLYTFWTEIWNKSTMVYAIMGFRKSTSQLCPPPSFLLKKKNYSIGVISEIKI